MRHSHHRTNILLEESGEHKFIQNRTFGAVCTHIGDRVRQMILDKKSGKPVQPLRIQNHVTACDSCWKKIAGTSVLYGFHSGPVPDELRRDIAKLFGFS